MLTVTTRAELRAELAQARADAAVLGSGRVAFVPTIGSLAESDLQLVDEARTRADIVVVSIVGEPRDPDGDAARARGRGVQLLFVPDVRELQPRPPRVLVTPGAPGGRPDGAARSGEAAGLLTVVAKLFHLVQPDVAVFGQSDAEHAALVRAMVEDLDMPIEIVVAPGREARAP